MENYRKPTTEEGLSHNSINYIIQGNDGLIWIGT
ncbi:two-component regulator propeller domain-containing protein [Ascidiimonas meishanensis]